MVKIAILIPCYNEGKTVDKVINDWKSAIKEAYEYVQVYVYDNNCTDNTAYIAASSGAVVVREPKQGKGNVIRSMFQDIDADCYLMVDGDDTYSPDHAVEMVDLILMRSGYGDRRPLILYVLPGKYQAIPWSWECTCKEMYQYHIPELPDGYHDRLPGIQQKVCEDLPCDQQGLRDRD